MVSDEEDGKLTSNGFKSKRPFSAYGNKSINIAICEQDILLWDELHRI
jgi:hypothetical protein